MTSIHDRAMFKHLHQSVRVAKQRTKQKTRTFVTRDGREVSLSVVDGTVMISIV